MGINLHIDDAIIPEDLKPIIGSLFSPQEIPDGFSRNEFARFLKNGITVTKTSMLVSETSWKNTKTIPSLSARKINVISGMKTYPATAKAWTITASYRPNR